MRYDRDSTFIRFHFLNTKEAFKPEITGFRTGVQSEHLLRHALFKEFQEICLLPTNPEGCFESP